MSDKLTRFISINQCYDLYIMNKLELNPTLQKIVLSACETIANNFEHFYLSSEEVKDILSNDENINGHITRTIIQFRDCFMWVLVNKDPLSFDDIKLLHQKLAHELALNEGEFALGDRHVTSMQNEIITIKPKDEKTTQREFNTLTHILAKETDQQIKLTRIINFFIQEITEQWFYDANKRSSLLVVNKLLLDYASSEHILLLIDFDNKKFNELLAHVYFNKYIDHDVYLDANQALIDFLINSLSEFDLKDLNNPNEVIKSASANACSDFLSTLK